MAPNRIRPTSSHFRNSLVRVNPRRRSALTDSLRPRRLGV
jgi:hypothetical protein